MFNGLESLRRGLGRGERILPEGLLWSRLWASSPGAGLLFRPGNDGIMRGEEPRRER